MPILLSGVTFIESLLINAKNLFRQKNNLSLHSGTDGPYEFNIIALSVRFCKTPLAFQFRALFENWSRSKLVSEMSAHGY